ncbi:MAG: hypothetical protein HYU33_02935 [Candidatus Omnitrophica bacterium]|nr:hypothetical protein [Candidatus Omnitrophota bacterium]
MTSSSFVLKDQATRVGSGMLFLGDMFMFRFTIGPFPPWFYGHLAVLYNLPIANRAF